MLRNSVIARESVTAKGDPASAHDVWTGINKLGTDALKLAGLQSQLLQADLKAWYKTVRLSLVLLLIALALVVGSIPSLIAGVALWLERVTPLATGGAFLIVAVLFSVVGVIIGGIALKNCFRSAAEFRLSREELVRNIEWLKSQFESDSSK